MAPVQQEAVAAFLKPDRNVAYRKIAPAPRANVPDVAHEVARSNRAEHARPRYGQRRDGDGRAREPIINAVLFVRGPAAVKRCARRRGADASQQEQAGCLQLQGRFAKDVPGSSRYG